MIPRRRALMVIRYPLMLITLFLMALGAAALGCGSARWEPARTAIPIPPGPDADSGDAFGDDDDEAAEHGLIPRKVLFGNPDKTAPRISPDGKRLAFLAPREGVLNVWVAPIDDLAKAQVVTDDKKRGIRRYFWTYSSNHLVYLQDKGGDENWRAYAVDVASKKVRDLTPLDGVKAQIQEVSHKHPDAILVGLNDRDKRYHDVYRVELASGKRTLVQKNDGFGSFVTDDDFAVRFAQKPTPSGGEQLLIRKKNGDFKPWARIGMEDSLTTAAVGFDGRGATLYMIDSRGRDTAALTSQALGPKGDRPGKTIAAFEGADVADLLLHPTKKTVQAAAATRLRKKWKFIDPAVAADFAVLAKVTRGDIEITSRTLDDKHWIVAFVGDDQPVRYYHYERAKKKARFLFVNKSALEGLKLARMQPVVIKSRDGLDLVSYLTLPVDAATGTSIKPAAPLPMVLLVHGGPWSRDSWGYRSFHQWIANRGYAVLSVNYRGSTGFGKSFINKSNRQWARTMHDDLIDAVKWAVDQKIAQPDKVAIMGGSYGGYATLVGLTFTPKQFACGVDIVGPSNLVTLLESIPPYWAPYLAMFAKRVGDHKSDAGKKLLRERSPLTFADRIERPLLIGQGANDPRVKQAESDQIVKAMQQKSIPVSYVLFPDEGHGFRRPENMTSFQAVAEAFLSRCLGGAVEPIGNDFEGASIQVPVGAEHVPGLKAALQ